MTSKVLGRATYRAYRLLGVTHIVATGETPNWNDKVDFEQLPFMIFPPMYAFYVVKQDISLPAVRPFVYEEQIVFPASAKAIHIQDADGGHVVPIAEVVPPINFNAMSAATDSGASYCVFSWIGINPLKIAKCDAILPSVYTRVFGPATFADCQKYVADNGGISEGGGSAVSVQQDTFRAWIDRMPIAGPKLIVTGEVVVPTGGWAVSLSPVVPQGFNPGILILQLNATAPTGMVTQVETRIPVRYEESPAAHPYTGANIRHAGGEFTLGVGITH